MGRASGRVPGGPGFHRRGLERSGHDDGSGRRDLLVVSAPACPSQAAIDAVFADVAAAGTVNPASDTLDQSRTAPCSRTPCRLGRSRQEAHFRIRGRFAPSRKIMTFQNNVVGEINQRRLQLEPARARFAVRQGHLRPHRQRAGVRPGRFQPGRGRLDRAVDARDRRVGRRRFRTARASTRPLSPRPARRFAQYLPGGAFGLNCPPTGGCTNSQAFPVPAELATLLDSRTRPERERSTLQRYLNFMPSRATNNQSHGLPAPNRRRGLVPEPGLDVGSVPLARRDDDRQLSLRRLGVGPALQASGAGAELRPRLHADVGDRSARFQHPVHDRAAARCGLRAVGGLHRRDRRAHEAVHALGADDRRGQPARRHRRHARRASCGSPPASSSRENTALFEPDPLVDAQSTRDNPIGLFPQNETEGETDVSEIYGELLIPVLDRASISSSAIAIPITTREGGIDTYKALFDWAATDSFRVRGGRQIANRAPNVAELFTGTVAERGGILRRRSVPREHAQYLGQPSEQPESGASASAVLGDHQRAAGPAIAVGSNSQHVHGSVPVRVPTRGRGAARQPRRRIRAGRDVHARRRVRA